MTSRWKSMLFGAVLTVAILISSGLWLLASYRKANANAQQLVGTWKLISGGSGDAQVIELRDDGSMKTSSTTRGKTNQFDGKYLVGSRRITLTVLANRRPPMDWGQNDDFQNSEQSSPATQNAAVPAAEKKDEIEDEEPKLEEAVMEILSLTKSEFVIAETDGHRLIYRRQ